MILSIHQKQRGLPMVFVFFFNDTATTEIYTLSLHDALPICGPFRFLQCSNDLIEPAGHGIEAIVELAFVNQGDRKSTRLNSSHANISYAVFCLKKKTEGPSQKSLFCVSIVPTGYIN